VNESDPKLLDLQSALAEVQHLPEENVGLRRLLQEQGIQIPAQSTIEIPVTTRVLPNVHAPVLKAEPRHPESEQSGQYQAPGVTHSARRDQSTTVLSMVFDTGIGKTISYFP
jgi:hypothetical protein